MLSFMCELEVVGTGRREKNWLRVCVLSFQKRCRMEVVDAR